jgi:hypothetical protein
VRWETLSKKILFFLLSQTVKIVIYTPAQETVNGK